MIKVVLFDLDDTLTSEKEYIKSGYKCISKILKEKYKIDLQEKEIFNKMLEFFNNNRKNVFNQILEYYKIQYTENDIKYLIDTYRRHKPNIKFYDDVLESMEIFKKQNKKLGIISDGYIEMQKAKIESLNAKKIFDKIILTEELGRQYWKPSPKAFEMMKEYFNVNYNEMMYVGDNPNKDFFIKKIYPIYTVRICRDDGVYCGYDYYENVKEDEKIKNIKELIKE